MKDRILAFVRNLRTSYWFVPAMMACAAMLFSWLLVAADHRFRDLVSKWPDWLLVHEIENARVVLSTIAGSMITVAGVTFSIVIVALSLASSQFGPRLMVNFMRDTGNQVVLGTFISTFVYSILVLRQLHDGDQIPQLAATMAVVLSLASLGVLIYFFHHVSVTIQAEEVVAQAGELVERAVETQIAKHSSDDGEGDGDKDRDDDRTSAAWPEDFDDGAAPVPARGTGYLNFFELDNLIELAKERDLRLRIAVKNGEFVVDGSPLVEVVPSGKVDDELIDEINDLFHLVRRRGAAEDLELAIDRLTEIAVRALSPGINDPYTAFACIDRLGAGLALLAERPVPVRDCHDADGALRVRRRTFTFAELIAAPFEQILLYGRDNPAVLTRLLDALVLIASRVQDHTQRQALLRQAELIDETAAESLGQMAARDQVRQKLETARRLLH